MVITLIFFSVISIIFGLITYIVYLRNKNVDPSKFDHIPSRLKFKFSSYDSNEYVTPYFYHRYRWVPLLKLEKPADTFFRDFDAVPITYRLGNGDFYIEKVQWSTVGACLRNNQEVKKQLEIYLNLQKTSALEKKNKLKEAYKRANNPIK